MSNHIFHRQGKTKNRKEERKKEITKWRLEKYFSSFFFGGVIVAYIPKINAIKKHETLTIISNCNNKPFIPKPMHSSMCFDVILPSAKCFPNEKKRKEFSFHTT